MRPKHCLSCLSTLSNQFSHSLNRLTINTAFYARQCVFSLFYFLLFFLKKEDRLFYSGDFQNQVILFPCHAETGYFILARTRDRLFYFGEIFLDAKSLRVRFFQLSFSCFVDVSSPQQRCAVVAHSTKINFFFQIFLKLLNTKPVF